MVALVVENPLDRTGVGRYTSYLIELLDSRGVEYDILDYTCSVTHKRAVKRGSFIYKLSYLLVVLGLRDIFFDDRYDKFIFPTASTLSVLMGGNKIVAVHDLMHRFYDFREVSRFDIRVYRDRLYKSLAISKATIVVDSRVGVEHWIRFYGDSSRVNAIPFYASLIKKEPTQSRLLSEHGLENFLLYPAAFWSHKNHINLIKAVQELVTNSDLKFKIVLCGRPNGLLQKIKGLITDLNLELYFEIFDFISDDELIEFYTNSKGLIFPSYFGPTNIPPLEAISLGVPVAVADVFHPKEIYGKGILSFDPNNIQEISEACRLLLSSNNVYLGSISNKKQKFQELWMGLIYEN